MVGWGFGCVGGSWLGMEDRQRKERGSKGRDDYTGGEEGTSLVAASAQRKSKKSS